jgi:hypothetical protein
MPFLPPSQRESAVGRKETVQVLEQAKSLLLSGSSRFSQEPNYNPSATTRGNHHAGPAATVHVAGSASPLTIAVTATKPCSRLMLQIGGCVTPSALRALFYQFQSACFLGDNMATSVVLVVDVSSQTANTRDLETFFGHVRFLTTACLPLKVTRVEIESSPSNPPPLLLLLTLRDVAQKFLKTVVVIKPSEFSPCCTTNEFLSRLTPEEQQSLKTNLTISLAQVLSAKDAAMYEKDDSKLL